MMKLVVAAVAVSVFVAVVLRLLFRREQLFAVFIKINFFGKLLN